MKKFLKIIRWALFWFPWVVFAQWTTQTVQLQQGWNAVYLTVQPVPAACDAIFDGVPVERISMWTRDTGNADYVSDVSEQLPRPADWLVWRPASNENAYLNDLGMMLAGKAYLIEMSTAATLTIKGRAVIVEPEWMANEMSFTGFPVENGVSFASVLEHTDEVGMDYSDGGELYEVLSDGSEMLIFRPSQTAIKQGQAYWVKTEQELDYPGMLEVSFSDRSDYVDFGTTHSTRTLRIKNCTDDMRTVQLTLMDSEEAPDGFTTSSGPLPLLTTQLNMETLTTEYIEFTGALTTNIAANSTFEITLLPDSSALSSTNEMATWERLLNISDGEIVQTVGFAAQQTEEIDYTGLWVGTIAVDGVSRAPTLEGGSNTWDTVETQPVPSIYSFRVLLHVGSNGTNQLLQQAFPAFYLNDEDEMVSKIYTTAAQAKLFLSDYPDGQIVRISSANFPVMNGIPLAGDFGEIVDGEVNLAYDDATNPFVHAFHPDHDNISRVNGVISPLEAGIESFEVNRNLQFTFAESDPLGANPKWGIDEMGGTFAENVTGLNKIIYVSGAFRLEKVSSRGVLGE